MLRIKYILIIWTCLVVAQNRCYSQGSQSLLDSIVHIYQAPKGITVYPIDFQKTKVSEDFLVSLNAAHYEGIAQSGVVDPKRQLSKKYVKKKENDVTYGEFFGHLPQNLISTVKVLSCEYEGDLESDYMRLLSIELLVQHSIYDIATGKKLHMSVFRISPSISNMGDRAGQNQEISKIFTENIINTMTDRFPSLSFLKSVNTIEKEKAITVDIDLNYSVKTNKKNLYAHTIKNTFYINGKPHYQLENIGRVDYDKNIDAKNAHYNVKKGKEEIHSANKNNQTIILSPRPLE